MKNPTQILLIAEATSDAKELLAAALEHAPIASVLIVPPGWRAVRDGDEPIENAAYDNEICRHLIELTQRHGAAALLANDFTLADQAGADGIQLDASPMIEDLYRATRQFFGRDANVGVNPGRSRHLAMTLAEAGADYVAFAVTGADDQAGLELVAWWAEVFEVPVVALGDGSLETCRKVIDAGAEFVGLPVAAHENVAGMHEHMGRVRDLIEAASGMSGGNAK